MKNQVIRAKARHGLALFLPESCKPVKLQHEIVTKSNISLRSLFSQSTSNIKNNKYLKMNFKAKQFFKFFIIMAIGFWAVQLIAEYLFINAGPSLISLVVKSVIFGLFMALFFTAKQFYDLDQLGLNEITEKDLSPTQVRFVPSDQSTTQIADAIAKDGTFLNVKQEGDTVFSKKKFSIYSWGENIVVSPAVNANIKGYKVKSKPIFFQLIDNGSGLKNVMYLEKLILGL